RFGGAEVTIDLYELIRVAKNKKLAPRALQRLMPPGKVDDTFAEELVAM
ncbi:MAG: hypothetical protein JNK48_24845, partial [Bryobacterales bacterium]|nr:hypothetical protein [Bryobacterales bacterium]